MKIKLYRHTIKHTEYIPKHLGGVDITFYKQTGWISIKNYRPGENKETVKIEEKEIDVKDAP